MKERLAELVKASGLTQSEAAKMTGIAEPTMSQYLSGGRNIQADWFEKTAIPVLTKAALNRVSEITDTLAAAR